MIHMELFNKIDDHFVSDHSLARVCAFRHAARQVEGRFKGELLLPAELLRRGKFLAEGAREYWPR